MVLNLTSINATEVTGLKINTFWIITAVITTEIWESSVNHVSNCVWFEAMQQYPFDVRNFFSVLATSLRVIWVKQSVRKLALCFNRETFRHH